MSGCKNCAALTEKNKSLAEQNSLLEKIVKEHRQRIDKLEKRIRKLEKTLAVCTNAHTPPSRRLFYSRKSHGPKGRPGRKHGHEGITRAMPEPDETVKVTADRCCHCGRKLGEPARFESRTIEDIPEPQPVKVTEFLLARYRCSNCGRETVAKHPECPKKGRFGKNLTSQVTLMKYSDRMPYRKIRNALKRQYGIDITTATVFELTQRTAGALRQNHELILQQVRESDVVYSDETGIRVNGKGYWIWGFTTDGETAFVISDSRGKKVLERALEGFKGVMVCDGWKSYSSFTDKVQRCWAHLLREADHLAENEKEAMPLADALHSMYDKAIHVLQKKPPPNPGLWRQMRRWMGMWLGKDYESEAVGKLVAKIGNGFDHWFTFTLVPGVEPTNNRAERALREQVVQRKITGTLRNRRGTLANETIMSCLATWEQQGLNPHEEMMRVL